MRDFLTGIGVIVVAAIGATVLWSCVRFFFDKFFLNPWDRLSQREQVWIYHKIVDDYRDKLRQAIARGEIKLPPGMDDGKKSEGNYL